MLKLKKKDLNQPVTLGVFDDALMHEVKAMREEQSAHAGNHKDLVDDIQGHEKRIKRLEAHGGIN